MCPKLPLNACKPFNNRNKIKSLKGYQLALLLISSLLCGAILLKKQSMRAHKIE